MSIQSIRRLAVALLALTTVSACMDHDRNNDRYYDDYYDGYSGVRETPQYVVVRVSDRNQAEYAQLNQEMEPNQFNPDQNRALNWQPVNGRQMISSDSGYQVHIEGNNNSIYFVDKPSSFQHNKGEYRPPYSQDSNSVTQGSYYGNRHHPRRYPLNTHYGYGCNNYGYYRYPSYCGFGNNNFTHYYYPNFYQYNLSSYSYLPTYYYNYSWYYYVPYSYQYRPYYYSGYRYYFYYRWW